MSVVVNRALNENKDELLERISKAHSFIKTTLIKNTEYVQVNQRVKAFRYVYPKGKIETKIISLDGEIGNRTVLMRCEVYDDLGNLLSTGYAEEKESSTFINKTSFIENCETSCLGRALGQSGFGIDVSIASAEEVETAIENQKKPQKMATQKQIDLVRNLYQEQELLDKLNIKSLSELTLEVASALIKKKRDESNE